MLSPPAIKCLIKLFGSMMARISIIHSKETRDLKMNRLHGYSIYRAWQTFLLPSSLLFFPVFRGKSSCRRD